MSQPIAKTRFIVYEGSAELLALFQGTESSSLSKFLPQPEEFKHSSELAWTHYELLFGDEHVAVELLKEFGIHVLDPESYKAQTLVRHDAYNVMQLILNHGAVSPATWRKENWGGPDREVRLRQPVPVMIMEMDGDSSKVMKGFAARYPGLSVEIVLVANNDDIEYEVSRLSHRAGGVTRPYSSAKAQFCVENQVRFEA